VGSVRNGEEKVVRNKRAILFTLFGTLLLVLAACGGGAQVSPTATAELKDKEGGMVGNAQFSEDENGVNIAVTILQGITPGEHGIHIHEKGKITPDFEAADYSTTTDRVTLARGKENSLLDEDGSALVIHAKADDYRTDPSGNTGDRVAAGVIQGS
jgi:Cu-Zn family superoxide dismutase